MAKPFLSVIIPAYNEAERLPITLIDIDKHLSRAGYSYEILVVNNASRDKTSLVAKKFQDIIRNLKVLDNETNDGKGAAVKKGMLLTRGEIRLFLDADNAVSTSQCEKILQSFREGAKIAIGSRSVNGSQRIGTEPFYRSFLRFIANGTIKILFSLPFGDTQCGFKAFREEAAEKIFSNTKINGWAFDVEALVLSKRFGYPVKEIPVIWENVRSSRFAPRDYLKTLLELFKIRWWLWTHKYS